MTPEKQWFVKTQSGRSGPFEFQRLQYFADRGKIKPNTAISKGQGNWIKAKRVEGLYFPGDPPPGSGHEERPVMPDSSVDGLSGQSSPFGLAARDSELSSVLEDSSSGLAMEPMPPDEQSSSDDAFNDDDTQSGVGPSESDSVVADVASRDDANRFAQVSDREAALAAREARMAAREADLASRESTFSEREANFAQRESALRDREADCDSLEMEVRSRESDVGCREAEIELRETELTRREAELRRREAQFITRETERVEEKQQQQNESPQHQQ